MTQRGFMRTLWSGVLAIVMTTASACLIKPFDADCPGKSSCDSCMESAGCGWCSEDSYGASGEGKCLAGTSLGPADEDACKLTRFYYEVGCYVSFR